MELPWIDGKNPVFPHPDNALKDPDGLLAVGGNLQPRTLLQAYRMGIFPWFDQGQPILWWSPSQRAVLQPGQAHISRSLRKSLQKGGFSLTTNTDFAGVIAECAKPRKNASGTWITNPMRRAYTTLHQMGHAHSVECWQSGMIVGGLYGVQVGNVFCGESMFSHVSNASKIAFIGLSSALATNGFRLIDCQLENPHLSRLGVKLMPRAEFLEILATGLHQRINWPVSTGFNSALMQS